MVKTLPFHGSITGSNPVVPTKRLHLRVANLGLYRLTPVGSIPTVFHSGHERLD